MIEESLNDRIHRRAYEIWEREGKSDAQHDQHWQKAQAEIAAEDATQNVDAGMAITPRVDSQESASPGADKDAKA